MTKLHSFRGLLTNMTNCENDALHTQLNKLHIFICTVKPGHCNQNVVPQAKYLAKKI